MSNRKWTREELILAMDLYCRLPFGRYHRGNPDVVRLASAIDRTPSSVAMKLSNLASLDPAHQQRGVKGLANASVADQEVWDEFHADWEQLAIESDRLRSSLGVAEPNERDDPERIVDLEATFEGPTEAQRTVKSRIAQRFFRQAVLASYEAQCCVTGIANAKLLIASHIAPWSRYPQHRANPRNGLCLSRLHDAAFDRGLITFDDDYRLVLSRELAEECANDVLHASFTAFEGQTLQLPQRFWPDPELLQTHRDSVFCG